MNARIRGQAVPSTGEAAAYTTLEVFARRREGTETHKKEAGQVKTEAEVTVTTVTLPQTQERLGPSKVERGVPAVPQRD